VGVKSGVQRYKKVEGIDVALKIPERVSNPGVGNPAHTQPSTIPIGC